MVDDLTRKVQTSQTGFEALVSRLPGFGGYKDKEQRREADKLLRLHVARRFAEQLSRLGDIQREVTDLGDFKTMMVLERAVMKLQLLIDRLKTASYGYAGLFDALKVDEDVLDRLYAFDLQMLDGVERVSSLLEAMSKGLSIDQSLMQEARELVNELESLNNLFSRRQDVILGE